MKPNAKTGKCPACTKHFDPHSANPAFVEEIEGCVVQMIYAFCPKCKSRFDLSIETERKALANDCFKNVKLGQDSVSFTVTSSLALIANSWDFYRAWKYGADISRPMFDLINAGLVNEYINLSRVDKLGDNHAE